jgi:hypothetical protein
VRDSRPVHFDAADVAAGARREAAALLARAGL